MRNLVSESLDLVLEFEEVCDSSSGGLIQNISNKNDDFSSSCFIDAGDDGGWVGEFVLLEQAVESLLEDLFVGKVWLFADASQHFVGVACTVEADLVVFSGFPESVEVSEPFVDFEVVKSGVCDDLLFKGSSVGVVVNTVFEAQSF